MEWQARHAAGKRRRTVFEGKSRRPGDDRFIATHTKAVERDSSSVAHAFYDSETFLRGKDAR